MSIISDVIIKPVISEKSFAEAKMDKYTFVVARAATKVDVRNAIEAMFGVKVIRTYTANVKGTKTKNTRFGRKLIDTTYKKATVKLLKGQKIDLFEEKTKNEEKKDKKKGKSA